MIKHLVLWKFDESYTSEEKNNLMENMRDRLLALKDKISEIHEIQVYFNDDSAAAANFDIMLDTEFDSLDDLNAYQVHPEHVKVLQYVKSLKLQRAAIDYPF